MGFAFCLCIQGRHWVKPYWESVKIKFKNYEHWLIEYLDIVRYKRKQPNKTERRNIHRGIRGQNQLRDIKNKKFLI